MTESEALEKLASWTQLKEYSTHLVEQERALRKELAEHFFHDHKEGMNNHMLPHNYVLKCSFPIDRKITRTAAEELFSLTVENAIDRILASECLSGCVNESGAPITASEVIRDNADCSVLRFLTIDPNIIDWEPKLSISKYRMLTEGQRNFIDMFLTSKPGSVQMEVVKPKDD